MDWWKAYRKAFPVTEKCVYMDAAYDCGGSTIGKAAAARHFEDWANAAATAQRGGPGRDAFFRVAENCRGQLSALLGGVPTRNIAFTKNTNEGVNSIVHGFDFKPGDNVVTLKQEYPSLVMPCIHAMAQRGVGCKLAELPDDWQVPVDLLWNAVDDRTVMVLVSHVQSRTGYKIDLQELGRRCRERGIFLVVDAVQSMGLERLPAEQWGVSAVCGAGYKGLGAFISIGYLYACDALLARVAPTYVSHNFHLSLDFSGAMPAIVCSDPLNASKLDNCSSDYLGIYVLNDAVARINEIGVDNIAQRIDSLFRPLYAGLKALGYRIVTPENPENRCASIAIATEHCKEIIRYFYDQGVVIGGSVLARISLGAFSNEADVARTLAVAERCPYR